MGTKVTRSLFVRFGGLLEILRYFFSLIARKPYFGPFMLANQTWPIREPHMRRAIRMLIEEGKKEELRVLEIGSWAGQSAIIWGSELVRSAYPGKLFCVDPWALFTHGNQVGVNMATSKMDSVARRDRIYPLFWHNVKSSGLAGHVLPLRCKSKEILPYLIPGSFDLVFVDGSHAYTDFLADLSLVAPLVKQSGFMCGDDLELQSMKWICGLPKSYERTISLPIQRQDVTTTPVFASEYLTSSSGEFQSTMASGLLERFKVAGIMSTFTAAHNKTGRNAN